MLIRKHPRPQWLTMEQAVKHCTQGSGIWDWASNDAGCEPDVVMACCGISNALIESGASSIQLILTMAGIICLWSGIMKIAVESGLTNIFAKIFAPLLRPLFPRLDKKSDAFQSITMNISANLLGLGNAATPFGLKAMEQLHTLNDRRDIASNEMVVFVVMNTASLQLLPTTLAALRQSYGSSAPFEIIVPVWISSACALTVALLIACTLNIRQGKI